MCEKPDFCAVTVADVEKWRDPDLAKGFSLFWRSIEPMAILEMPRVVT